MATLKILIADGNTQASNEALRSFGGQLGAERYAEEVLRIEPDADVSIVFPADHRDCLPRGTALKDYDGLVLGGSALHVFDAVPEVTQQIDLVRSALLSGVPVLGSCWGLQVGVVATGGMVAASPNGREVGIARKITLTQAGIAHPFFEGKKSVFDSPCIHFDEVTELPPGSEILATNGHSEVQATAIPFGQSYLWGVQYHPEFHIRHLALLYRRYNNGLLKDGFFKHQEDIEGYADDLDALHAAPNRADLGWQLAIDEDVLDPNLRCCEIKNWLESLVKK